MAAIDFQLKDYDTLCSGSNTVEGVSGGTGATSLFDTVASKVGDLIGVDETNLAALEQLEDSVLRRALGRWNRLPYPAWQTIRKKQLIYQRQQPNDEVGSEGPQPKRRKLAMVEGMEEDVDEWIIKNERAMRDEMYQQDKVVKGESCVFPTSVITSAGKARKITREDPERFKILDAKRTSFVYIQPSVVAYVQTFEAMTQGIFKGLDWSNIAVAGGMALGALLCVDGEPDSPHKTGDWKDSDIDVYIYGLGPASANAKIRHIYDIFKANLPAGQETLAVWHPKEVLLNFDLDICAVAYDGTEVWMFPRAARALETGYNVFTMDMVQGHYLGDRRATQEQRVFKYATKGYGLWFLPTYVSSYHAQDGPFSQSSYSSPRTLDHLVVRAHRWTNRIAETLRGYVQADKPLHLTHAQIDIGAQKTWEPTARTCLSGFELLMRHVALWEGDVHGKWTISTDKWTSSVYPDGLGGYDDTPKYKWDEHFIFSEFTKSIDEYNHKLVTEFCEALEEEPFPDQRPFPGPVPFKRISYGYSIADVLPEQSTQGDLAIPLVLPINFLNFVEEMLNEVFEDRIVPHKSANVLEAYGTRPKKGIHPEDLEDEEALILWKVTPWTMWQQVDRRIDEIHEIMWAFQRCGPPILRTKMLRVKTFCTQVSRRSRRLPRETELKAFGVWANIMPKFHHSVNTYDALYGMRWCQYSDDDRKNQSGHEDDEDEDEDETSERRYNVNDWDDVA